MVNGGVRGNMKIGFFSVLLCCLIIFGIWSINNNAVIETETILQTFRNKSDELNIKTIERIERIESELKQLKETIEIDKAREIDREVKDALKDMATNFFEAKSSR